MKRTVTIGRGQAPIVLTLKACRSTREKYGLGIWAVALLLAMGLAVMAHQDGLQPTPEQEAAFHQEQARRLVALGLTPVITNGKSSGAARAVP